MSVGARKLSVQERLPPPPPSRDGPPPPPARNDLPPPPPVPRRDTVESLNTSSLRSSAGIPPPPRLSPRKESDGFSPMTKALVASQLKSPGKAPPVPSTQGRSSIGSAPRPPPPAREDLRSSLASSSLPPPPPSRAGTVRGDAKPPPIGPRSNSPAPPPRDASPAPPLRRDLSPRVPPRDDLGETAEAAQEEPAEEYTEDPEPPPVPAKTFKSAPPPVASRGPPRPPPREEEDAPPPPPRALTQSAPAETSLNSFAAVATAIMKKPPALAAASAPPMARRGTAGEANRPTIIKPPALSSPPQISRPPPTNPFPAPPPGIRKASENNPLPVSATVRNPFPQPPPATSPSTRSPIAAAPAYSQPAYDNNGYDQQGEPLPQVDLSSYTGKYPPEKAARLVQNAYRRWKTLTTAKRLAKRAWTLRRFLNSEKIYVQTLSTIVGGIMRRIPDRSRAPPLFENLEPIANLHGQALQQLQAAVAVLKDGPSGAVPILLNIARQVNLYLLYADSYRNALSAFIQCRTQSNFQKFVENCETQLGGEPLLPCLMQPLTRFREYVHYTKLLLTWTAPSNPEHAELTNAVPTMENAYKQLTEGSGSKVMQDLDRTRLFILEVIGAQLKMKDIATQPGRSHVRSMDITQQDLKGKQSKMHIHLFNDVVLLTKRKEDKVRQSTPLDLKSYIQDEADKGSLRNWFKLVTPRETLTFIAESPPEKMKALWAFRDAFEQLRIIRGAENMTEPIIRRPQRNKGATARRRKKPAAGRGGENNSARANTYTAALPPQVRTLLAKAGVTERDLADPKTAEFIMKWLQATLGQQTNAASKYTLKPIAQAGGASGPSPMSMSSSQTFSSPSPMSSPTAARAPPPGPASPSAPRAPPPAAARAPAPPPAPKAPKAPPPPPAKGMRPPATPAYEEEQQYDQNGGDENGYGYEEQPAEEYASEETYSEETASEEAAPAAGGLLAALKGAQLRKVEASPAPQFKQISAAEEDGLAAALSKALQARRPALAEKTEESDEENDYDEGEWD